MDPFFSKYLKVCEHYCTTAPFYNWCKHKPYSGLVIDEGLPFALYFDELFSPTGDYKSLKVSFDPTSPSLLDILISRTSMIEKITRLFTLDCAFFENFDEQNEKITKEKRTLCKKIKESRSLCRYVRPSLAIRSTRTVDTILTMPVKRSLPGGGNRTFKRHPRDKHKRKHNDDGLTKHKTSNKLRRKKSVKN
jgi:hypothetical protein